MKKIELTQNQFAIVDDWWFDILAKYKWYAKWNEPTKSFYATRNSVTVLGKRKTIRMHRVIAGTPKGLQTDHINHDTLDNRESNLRNVTQHQNKMNKTKYKNNSSGFRGVTWKKENKKWRSQIRFSGKDIHLGYFEKIEDAIKEYELARKKLFGKFGTKE